jgi:predicted ABC-type ATPase
MAGRVALERLHMLAERKENFSFETTLAGKNHAGFLHDCINQGYIVTLTYLWLPSPELAIARVVNRIKQKGHSITEEIIRRRFHKGLFNLWNIYLPLCQRGVVLDNSTPAKKGELRPRIAEKLHGKLIIYDNIAWNMISNEAAYE